MNGMKEGKKTFVNETGKDLNITMFIRSGGNPEDKGDTEMASVPSGGQVEAIYEGFPGPEGYVFLNGLLIEWKEDTDYVGVSRKVGQRGDAWDNTLNTNDTVIISAVSLVLSVLSRDHHQPITTQPSTVEDTMNGMKEGKKTFVNETGKDLNITMFIRSGGNPEDKGDTEMASVPSGGQVEAIYEGFPGPEGYVFLNGLLIEWKEDTDYVGVSRKVGQRGDAWDNTLNTNDTVIISAVAAGVLNASGTNK